MADPGEPGSGEPLSGEEPAVPYIEEYLRLVEAQQAPELDEYLERVPAELRDRVREACLDLVSIRQVFPGELPEPEEVSVRGRQLGDFRLLQEIGRGGMGVVYLARQKSLHRLVAVKVLPSHMSVSALRVERFKREALSVAKIQHPSIIPIHAVGEDGDVHYFAMDYIEGRSLAEEIGALRDRRKWGRANDAVDRLGRDDVRSYTAEVAEIGAQLAEALHVLHQANVIHRDVKPANVLLAEGGRPVLIDFGLAKDLDEASISKSGDIAGSAYYMSPEQASAKKFAVDNRSDIFSLGVILYEMLTLQRPFQGKTSHQVIHAITVKEPPPIRSFNRRVPRDLETICIKALQKDPRQRYDNAADMAADLRRFLRSEAILARPPGVRQRMQRALVRHRRSVQLVGAAVIALVGGIWFSRSWNERQVFAGELSSLRAFAGRDLREMGMGQLREVAAAVRAAGARLRRLDGADRQLLEDLQGELRAIGEDKRDRGLALRGATLPKPVSLADAREQGIFSSVNRLWFALDGLDLLNEASELLDEPELARLATVESIQPRLSVSANVAGGQVYLRKAQLVSGRWGEPVPLGPLPVDEVPVSAGYYRVVVVAPEGFSEHVRYLDGPGKSYRVEANVQPTEGAVDGMIRFAGGSFTFGDPTNTDDFYTERQEEVDDFWLQETEVSNAEYREFVQETGYPEPLAWRDGYDEAWDDLPVVTVFWEDAIAYAEWRGLRLPSQFEWERAARGLSGRAVPWADGDVPDPERARFGFRFVLNMEEHVQLVAPVRSYANGRTPEGLYHMLGNVSEWTDSVHGRNVRGEPIPQPGYQILCGGSYTWGESNDLRQRTSTYHHSRSYQSGFRCAKSADPLQ